MDSTAKTGTRMEIPERSVISIETQLGSDVYTPKKALICGLAGSLRFHW
jgi:hypothetical protein